MGPAKAAKRGHIPKIKGEQYPLPIHPELADGSKDATSAHSVGLIAIEIKRLVTNALAEELYVVA